MNEFCDIKSDGLTMDQIFHSDSVWSLDERSLLNTQKKSFLVPTSQGVHAFFKFYDE